MKKILLVLLTSLLMVSCSDDKTSATTEAVKSESIKSESPHAILSYIPADTSVLMVGGLSNDQYPEKYIETMEGYMGGIGAYLKVAFEDGFKQGFKQETDKAQDDGSEAEIPEADKDKEILDFFEKWFVDGGLENFGIKFNEFQFALYMVDLFPVVRVTLSSESKVNQMIEELKTDHQMPVETSEMNGMMVHKIQTGKATIILALDAEQMVLSFSPSVLVDQLIDDLLGFKKPAVSLAQDRSLIDNIKSKYGFKYDDLMLIDIQSIADYFIYPAKHDSALLDFLQIEDNMLSEVCKTEISTMIAQAPRMIVGSGDITDDLINSSFIWEIDQELATDLSTISGRIPHGNANAALSFGMSIDLLNLKEVLNKYIAKRIETPYECEHFAKFNDKLTGLQAQLNQPIPPFVGSFKGFNVTLDTFEIDATLLSGSNPDPKEFLKDLKVQVYLAVDETKGLLAMAQMMAPQLSEIEINTDGSVISLADKIPVSGTNIPVDISTLYAAISENTIGFSLGHENGGTLGESVNQPGNNNLFKFYVEADAYIEMMNKFFDVMSATVQVDKLKQQLETQRELTLGMIFWKTQDATLNFTDKGFEMNMDITY